jgi:hypothetical protein
LGRRIKVWIKREREREQGRKQGKVGCELKNGCHFSRVVSAVGLGCDVYPAEEAEQQLDLVLESGGDEKKRRWRRWLKSTKCHKKSVDKECENTLSTFKRQNRL